jgi:tripartite-type tricarboxylate transporter receptor subunit TctC
MANGYGRRLWATVVAALALAVWSGVAGAAPYYEGKTITLVIPFKPGGTADADGRMVAQYLGRHIPGNPQFVVQNMPGAGGVKAINIAYEIAKPDGLSIYQLASGHFLQQLVGSSAIKFDLSKMPILGAWLHSTYVLSVRSASPYKSIVDIRKAKNPPQIGTQGLGTGTYIYTVAWQKALGIKFRLVTGYEGAEQTLALERGEIDGRTDTAASIVRRGPKWMAMAPPLVQNGPDRDPLIPDVPTVNDLNPNPGVFWDTINQALSMDRPYVLPPKTPPVQLKELRNAWSEMLKDKAFIADAAKRKWRIVPTSYEKVESFYGKAKDIPPDVIEQLKALFP